MYFFWDGLYVCDLHSRFKGCHCVALFFELSDVDVAEVTWWTIGTWARRLEPLGPSSATTNTE